MNSPEYRCVCRHFVSNNIFYVNSNINTIFIPAVKWDLRDVFLATGLRNGWPIFKQNAFKEKMFKSNENGEATIKTSHLHIIYLATLSCQAIKKEDFLKFPISNGFLLSTNIHPMS